MGRHFWHIIRNEQVLATHVEPDAAQYAMMEAYEQQYRRGLGHPPAGMHYLKSLGEYVMYPPPAELGIPEEPGA
jgi:hypothetical protein